MMQTRFEAGFGLLRARCCAQLDAVELQAKGGEEGLPEVMHKDDIKGELNTAPPDQN
jgi:hypothetical protein